MHAYTHTLYDIKTCISFIVKVVTAAVKMCVAKAKEIVEQEKCCMRAEIKAATDRVMDIASRGEDGLMEMYLRTVRTKDDLTCAIRHAAAVGVTPAGAMESDFRSAIEAVCGFTEATFHDLRADLRTVYMGNVSRMTKEVLDLVAECAMYMKDNDAPLIPTARFHSAVDTLKWWKSIQAMTNPNVCPQDMARGAISAAYEVKTEIMYEQKQQTDDWVRVRKTAISILEEKVRSLVRKYTFQAESIMLAHERTLGVIGTFVVENVLRVLRGNPDRNAVPGMLQSIADRLNEVVRTQWIPTQGARGVIKCMTYVWLSDAHSTRDQNVEVAAGGAMAQGEPPASQPASVIVSAKESRESPDTDSPLKQSGSVKRKRSMPTRKCGKGKRTRTSSSPM